MKENADLTREEVESIEAGIMVSLVSTVLNDVEGIVRFFERMRSQTRRPEEIVIVDAFSTDGTWEAIELEMKKSDAGWQVVAWQEKCNCARGRNLAIASARGGIIASTDIGCDWDPEWLEELVAPLEKNPGLYYVVDSWRVDRSGIKTDWAILEFHLRCGYEFIAETNLQAYSRSVAYRKVLWERIGGYPEDLTLAGDDMTFDMLVKKSGAPSVAVKTVRCYWHRFDSLRAFLKEERRNFFGAGEAAIMMRFIFVGVLRFGTEVACLGGSAVLFGFGREKFAAVLFFIALVSIGQRVWRFRHRFAAARSEGIRFASIRMMILFYLLKIAAFRGFFAGLPRGRVHCQAVRSRLRNSKEMSW